jgi:hypothetical protein
MKKMFLTIFALLLFQTSVFADTYVQGYYRKDGTYVQPHYRSSPDSNLYNNYSTKGNYNPHTGQKGYVNPNSVQQNYNNNNYGYNNYNYQPSQNTY